MRFRDTIVDDGNIEMMRGRDAWQWCVMCDRCGDSLLLLLCCGQSEPDRAAPDMSNTPPPDVTQFAMKNDLGRSKFYWDLLILSPDSLESQPWWRPAVWRVVVLILTITKCTSCCEGKRWTPIKINWSRLQGPTSWTFGSLVWQKHFTYHLHFNFPPAPVTPVIQSLNKHYLDNASATELWRLTKWLTLNCTILIIWPGDSVQSLCISWIQV